MNINAVIGSLVVVLLLGLGSWIYYSGALSAPATVIESVNPPAGETNEEEPVADPEFDVLVSYTEEGYSPASVTIAAGQTVRFVNTVNEATWPASAVHPTHSIYPGSSIQKCNTAEALGIFDACRGLTPGEFWEFTFTEVGEWRYHDHLHASHTGVIIVQ